MSWFFGKKTPAATPVSPPGGSPVSPPGDSPVSPSPSPSRYASLTRTNSARNRVGSNQTTPLMSNQNIENDADSLMPENNEQQAAATAIINSDAPVNIDELVTYEGSIWAKSAKTALGVNPRRPVFFNPNAKKKLECDINPGMMSGKKNFTIHGNTGDELALAYAAGMANLQGKVGLRSVASIVGTGIVAAVVAPVAITGAVVGATVGLAANLATIGTRKHTSLMKRGFQAPLGLGKRTVTNTYKSLPSRGGVRKSRKQSRRH